MSGAIGLLRGTPLYPVLAARQTPPIPLFYQGEGTRCPGCGKSHWYVGLSTAECAFCTTALPIAGAKDRQ